jgi:hypothetical protein
VAGRFAIVTAVHGNEGIRVDSIYILLSSLLVGGLITWRLLIGSRHELRHERQATASATPMLEGSGAEPDESYRAVTLRICPRPCRAAQLLRNKPFLVGQEPELPLPECNHRCSCSYLPKRDRRSPRDRRHPAHGYVRVRTAYAVPEQRGGRDRRRKGRFKYNGIY